VDGLGAYDLLVLTRVLFEVRHQTFEIRRVSTSLVLSGAKGFGVRMIKAWSLTG
jgi:hypothetical protein